MFLQNFKSSRKEIEENMLFFSLYFNIRLMTLWSHVFLVMKQALGCENSQNGVRWATSGVGAGIQRSAATYVTRDSPAARPCRTLGLIKWRQENFASLNLKPLKIKKNMYFFIEQRRIQKIVSHLSFNPSSEDQFYASGFELLDIISSIFVSLKIFIEV